MGFGGVGPLGRCMGRCCRSASWLLGRSATTSSRWRWAPMTTTRVAARWRGVGWVPVRPRWAWTARSRPRRLGRWSAGAIRAAARCCVSASGRDRVCSLDLTFSAPKSVSVLFAIGDEHTSRSLVEAHEEAVARGAGVPGAGGVSGASRPCRPDRTAGGRVRGGGVSAPDEPRGSAAAAHARGGGQPGPWLGWAVVGASWLSDLPARQGGGVAVSSAPTRGGE